MKLTEQREMPDDNLPFISYESRQKTVVELLFSRFSAIKRNALCVGPEVDVREPEVSFANILGKHVGNDGGNQKLVDD